MSGKPLSREDAASKQRRLRPFGIINLAVKQRQTIPAGWFTCTPGRAEFFSQARPKDEHIFCLTFLNIFFDLADCPIRYVDERRVRHEQPSRPPDAACAAFSAERCEQEILIR